MAGASLLELLQMKIDLLDGIIDLVALQHKLIESEEVPLLMENIAKRQEFIDAVDALEPRIAACPPPSEREQAAYEAALRDIRTQLEDIAAQDQQNETLAMQHLQHYQQEVRSANQFKQVMGAYIDPLFTEEAHYFDKRK